MKNWKNRIEDVADIERACVVLMETRLPGSWGKGKTFEEASAQLRRAGGDCRRIGVAYVAEDADAYVDGMGYFCYSGRAVKLRRDGTQEKIGEW